MTLLDAALTPLTICAGDRSWITDSSKLQLITPGCDMVQTINSPVGVIPEERYGDLRYATRTSDYPEVVVYKLVWRQ